MEALEILLVEDNDGDVLLIEEALEDSQITHHLHVIQDGEAAIDFMLSLREDEKAITPDLILLDINLPKKNGYEVLQVLKGNRTLRSIPVVMLTTSSSEKDILKSYEYHANCLITKPADVNNFLEAIKKIGEFWLRIVHLPKIPI